MKGLSLGIKSYIKVLLLFVVLLPACMPMPLDMPRSIEQHLGSQDELRFSVPFSFLIKASNWLWVRTRVVVYYVRKSVISDKEEVYHDDRRPDTSPIKSDFY